LVDIGVILCLGSVGKDFKMIITFLLDFGQIMGRCLSVDGFEFMASMNIFYQGKE